MHKYVLVMIGAFFLIASTFPIAMKRVADSEKFTDAHLNSWTVEGKTKPKVAAK